MKDYVIYIVIALVIGLYFLNNYNKSKKALTMLENGSVVIDVRTPQEYQSGHYPNSINIPLNSLQSKIDEIKSYDNGIIVVCASGIRSSQAKSILSKNGIEAFNGGSWKNL